MDIKKLKSASGLLEQLKTIDQEIIKLDKLAMSIANKKCDIEVELKVVDLEKVEKETEERLKADTDSMEQSSIFDVYWTARRYRYGGESQDSKPKKNKLSLSEKVSDTESLEILAILLRNKRDKQRKIISRLEKLGVSC